LAAAAATLLSPLMVSGHSSWVGFLVVFYSVISNYFINSVQTASGQTGASPSWKQLTYPVGKLQTAKSVETQNI